MIEDQLTTHWQKDHKPIIETTKMLSNLAFSSIRPRMVESPSPRRKSSDRIRQASESKNILTVSNTSRNSPPQLKHTDDPGAPIIHKTSSKPLYIDERDDETVSLLSEDNGLLLDTRFEYGENENSGPSCSFGSASLQQQQYMGGNYFFRQNNIATENDYLDIVVSFPSKDQADQDPHSLRGLSSPVATNKIEVSNRENEDLQQLVKALRQEKLALSQKCSELETMVNETRHDHNCYKVKMTMAMGSLRVQMESERDDKAYLMNKCQQLTTELSELRTDYDSKLGTISALENQLRRNSLMTTRHGQEEEAENL